MSNWFTLQKSGYVKIPITDVARNPNLTPEEKAIITALGSYNPCRPSFTEIGKVTGLSRDSVNKWLKLLRSQNVIDRVRGNSNGKCNEYVILPSSEWRLLPLDQKNHRKKKGQKSAIPNSSSQQLPTPNRSINNNINSDSSRVIPGHPESNAESSSNNHLNENTSNQPEVCNSDHPTIVGFKDVVGSFSAKSDEAMKYFEKLIKFGAPSSLGEIGDILRNDGIKEYWPEGLQHYANKYREIREVQPSK